MIPVAGLTLGQAQAVGRLVWRWVWSAFAFGVALGAIVAAQHVCP